MQLQLSEQPVVPAPVQPDEQLPAPEPEKGNRLPKKTLLIIAGAVIAVLLIGGVAYAAFFTNDDKQGEQTAEAPKQTTDQTEPAQTDTATPTDTPPATDQPPSQSSDTGSNTPTPAPSAPSPKTYNISYTNSCYSPSTLTIKKGDTVVFKNNSSNRDMWPASDEHPSHNIYSEFDANGDIAPGGTYTFTFTKVGTWGFHDHNRANCEGTITVQ